MTSRNGRLNGRTRKGKSVSLEELVVITLSRTDALATLLIEKGVVTDAEFKEKLLKERAVYQHILNPTPQWPLANFCLPIHSTHSG